MIVLGLTGSIGMGKSTTAQMLRNEGIPVWDADASVHKLYGPGGAGSAAIAKLVPLAVTNEGTDRSVLREAIMRDDSLLKKIEQVIHPLVAADRAAFLDEAARVKQKLVICDIPLLFETGAEKWLDKVLVVTASAEAQRERVLARGTMSEEAFEAILAKQVPDAQKRERADYVIETGYGFDATRRDVQQLIAALMEEADA